MLSDFYSRLTITTPKKFLLDGLLRGQNRAEKGLIVVHGLGSSVFSQHLSIPVDDSILSLFFNNRGHDTLTYIKKLNSDSTKGYDYKPAGKAHEVFSDCIDDIQGAVNSLKELGVKKIYLIGHSTGCQKSIFYLSRNDNQKQISGAVLLCPMSDYAWAVKNKPKKLAAAVAYAKKQIQNGKLNHILPNYIWPDDTIDAQRFLSLYTKNSLEEIFTYSHPEDKPTALQKVRLPLLVVLASKDEYAEREMVEIDKWFKKVYSSDLTTASIDSSHNFSGNENEVSSLILKWLNSH